MTAIKLSDGVRKALEAALVEESDFIDSLRRESFVENPERPGLFSSSCLVALRRPLDLETAELRRLEVDARRLPGGWEVVAVRGFASVDRS
jgi:hypothetical protein